MHKYIDVKKKLYFPRQNITQKAIVNDLIRYEIKNIRDDGENECIYYTAETLQGDYLKHRANYKSYIEKGLDLRMLMELRKSAVLPFEELDPNVYLEHRFAETVDDVKNIRKKFFQKINADYRDEDWQYFLLVRAFLGDKSEGFYCDLEDCYADGIPENVRDISDYVEDFVDAHMQGYPGYVPHSERRKKLNEI